MEQQPTAETPGQAMAAPEQAADDQLMFYSVMPQPKKHTTVIDPKVTVSEQAGAAKKKFVFPPKIKRWLLITLGLGVLGLAGFYGINKFSQNSYKSVNLLVAHPGNKSQNSNQPPPAAGEIAVSTSKDWQQKYFGSPVCLAGKGCGDGDDPDMDGLSNLEEYKAGTDPNNPDSDHDGLADGDEVHVFGSDPLSVSTAKDKQYSDADYMAGGYSLATKDKFTPSELQKIQQNMKQYGLHEPTITTLKDALVSLYQFTEAAAAAGQNASSTPSTDNAEASSTQAAASATLDSLKIDSSAKAKQDRDTQRSSTIQNIGIALIKYQTDHKAFPITSNFSEMVSALKPYLKVATNAADPINQDVFVYTYTPNQDGSDFTLSFYSETQNQLIKLHAADAAKYSAAQQGQLNDDQRRDQLDNLRTALLLYSNKNAGGTQQYVFPPQDKYKTELAPEFIPEIPKDPKTGKDYDYQVSATYGSFTLMAVLENPAPGTTGYLCNEEECRAY